jgi:hypothetical protein
VRRRCFGKPHQRAVANAAPGAHQPGRVEIGGGNHRARAERDQAGGGIRQAADHAPNREARVSEGQLVADPETEPQEQFLLDDGAPPGQQLTQRTVGHELESTIQGIPGFHGAQLDGRRATAGHTTGHRDELLNADNPSPVGGKARQLCVRRPLQGPRRAELDVTAEKRLRLACQCPFQIRGQRADRHHRSHPDHDAHEHDGEMPPAAAGLAPGEARGQRDRHRVSLRRPRRRRRRRRDRPGAR